MSADWRPLAGPDALALRAALLRSVREFFHQRQVMEVDTPLLCASSATDPQLASLEVSLSGRTFYLQTSPEFAMKRLLASGSGPIYQLGKVFRADESGRYHNPEFTLLEWYRPGLDETQLMAEVDALLDVCVPDIRARHGESRTVSYRELFEQHLAIDPHTASEQALMRLAREHLDVGEMSADRDQWLQLLFTHLLEPQLKGINWVTGFPASQAALAQVHKDERGVPVARRFELYVNGLELANGYYELLDAGEQRWRFEADNQQRAEQGLAQMPVDERLLAALSHGMPEGTGVALGFDRLVMLAAGADRIADVLAFTSDNA